MFYWYAEPPFWLLCILTSHLSSSPKTGLHLKLRILLCAFRRLQSRGLISILKKLLSNCTNGRNCVRVRTVCWWYLIVWYSPDSSGVLPACYLPVTSLVPVYYLPGTANPLLLKHTKRIVVGIQSECVCHIRSHPGVQNKPKN